MSITVTEVNGESRITIDDEMTIYTAAVLKDALMSALADGDDFEIALDRVTEMDSAGLQIMIAFKQACDAAAKRCRFVGHSVAVIEVLETLRLSAYFGDPIVLAAEA